MSADRQRLATWILTRCLSEHRRDAFIGDLLEQYDERGSWWYWRQTLGAVRASALSLVWNATQTQVQAAEFIGDLILWIALGMSAFIQLPIYADLLISWTPLAPSTLSIIVVSAMIGATLLGAATTVHGIRVRTSRAPRIHVMLR